MLIGTSCSVSTAPIAELSPNWNLVQVSDIRMSYTHVSVLAIAKRVNGLCSRYLWQCEFICGWASVHVIVNCSVYTHYM